MRSALRLASQDPDRTHPLWTLAPFDVRPGPASERHAIVQRRRASDRRDCWCARDLNGPPPRPRPRSRLLTKLMVASDCPQPWRTERTSLWRIDVGTPPTACRVLVDCALGFRPSVGSRPSRFILSSTIDALWKTFHMRSVRAVDPVPQSGRFPPRSARGAGAVSVVGSRAGAQVPFF